MGSNPADNSALKPPAPIPLGDQEAGMKTPRVTIHTAAVEG